MQKEYITQTKNGGTNDCVGVTLVNYLTSLGDFEEAEELQKRFSTHPFFDINEGVRLDRIGPLLRDLTAGKYYGEVRLITEKEKIERPCVLILDWNPKEQKNQGHAILLDENGQLIDNGNPTGIYTSTLEARAIVEIEKARQNLREYTNFTP